MRADIAYVIPKEAPDGKYIEALLDLCRKEGVQLVIPGFDSELPYLLNARPQFKKHGIDILVGSQQLIEVANDKFKTQEYLAALNFPHLKTFRAEELDRALDG